MKKILTPQQIQRIMALSSTLRNQPLIPPAVPPNKNEQMIQATKKLSKIEGDTAEEINLMNNSSKKPNYSPTPYTMEEFRSKLDLMLGKYGISAQMGAQASSSTSKPNNYEVKMNLPTSQQEIPPAVDPNKIEHMIQITMDRYKLDRDTAERVVHNPF